MHPFPALPRWTLAAPAAAWAAFALTKVAAGPLIIGLVVVALIAAVLASVHHAEVVAHRVGEPYGTLVLAVSVTVIEVALILSLMLEGTLNVALLRDSVFAAVMIIINGMLGLCLLAGALRHGEQAFQTRSASAALGCVAALTVLTLVLPNFTTSVSGPIYTPSQLGFVAGVSVVLYGTFVLVQTVRNRALFMPIVVAGSDEHAVVHARPSGRLTALALVLLAVSLAAVVILAETLAGPLEHALDHAGAPEATSGVIIAALVLLPESLAAARAARANALQTSLNLAFGSALASIGMTLPVVAAVALWQGWTLTLGLDTKAMVLLGLSLLVASLSLQTGRTTILQGVTHLVIFAVYLFTTVVP